MNLVLGLATAFFAVVGVLHTGRVVGQAIGRAGRAVGRTMQTACQKVGTWFRSWRTAVERRRVKREEGLRALATETAATLATLAVDQRTELTALRAELAAALAGHPAAKPAATALTVVP